MNVLRLWVLKSTRCVKSWVRIYVTNLCYIIITIIFGRFSLNILLYNAEIREIVDTKYKGSTATEYYLLFFRLSILCNFEFSSLSYLSVFKPRLECMAVLKLIFQPIIFQIHFFKFLPFLLKRARETKKL